MGKILDLLKRIYGVERTGTLYFRIILDFAFWSAFIYVVLQSQSGAGWCVEHGLLPYNFYSNIIQKNGTVSVVYLNESLICDAISSSTASRK